VRRRRWPALVPLLAVSALAVALGTSVRTTLESPAGTAGTPTQASGVEIGVPDADLPRFEAPSNLRARLIVRRNLFSPERRPPPEDGDEAPDSQADGGDGGPDGQAETDGGAPKLNATLAGVVLGGRDQRAIVVTGDGGTKHQLAPGDRVEGWRLVGVTADTATFRRGDAETQLTLPFAATVAAETETTQTASTPDTPAEPETPADRVTPVTALENTPGFLADEQLPGGIPEGEDTGARPVTPRAKRGSESGQPARARNQGGVSDRVDKYRQMGDGE